MKKLPKKYIQPYYKVLEKIRPKIGLKKKIEVKIARGFQFEPFHKGKNIIKGYKKYYGVDWTCAIKELELLGVDLDPEYVKQLKITVKYHIIARQRQKERRKLEQEIDNFPYSDETFAFIAGYTSGGMPYEITWEEWEDEPQDLDDEKSKC